jgi:DNA polymerase
VGAPLSTRQARFDGTFAGFREEARALLLAGVRPEDVVWTAEDAAQDALPGLLPVAVVPGVWDDERGKHHVEIAPSAALRVPRAFLVHAERVAAHEAETRWDLLYRVLYRIVRGEHDLLTEVRDHDVARLYAMERAVMKEARALRDALDFRLEARPGGARWVACAPDVRPALLPALAHATAERFPDSSWSVLTPTRSIHGDATSPHAPRIRYGPGVRVVLGAPLRVR